MRRPLLLAVAVALTAAALPARAMTPATRWAPTSGQESVFARGLGGFADGTGYVLAGNAPGFDTRDTGIPDYDTRQVVLRTADFGRTWVPTVSALPASTNYAVAFTSALDGWASGFGTPALSRTSDGGATWAEASVPVPLAAGEDGSFWKLSASSSGGALAVTGSVRLAGTDPCFGGTARREVVFWTADGGTTWAEHRFPVNGTTGSVLIGRVRLADAGTGILVAHDGECDRFGDSLVYVTDDGGATWDLVLRREHPESGVVAAAISADGQRILLAFGDGSVHSSADGGATFSDPMELRTGTALDSRDTNVVDVALAGSVGYAVQGNGAVHRSADGGTTWAFDGVAGGLSPELALFDADRGFAVSGFGGPVTTRLP